VVAVQNGVVTTLLDRSLYDIIDPWELPVGELPVGMHLPHPGKPVWVTLGNVNDPLLVNLADVPKLAGGDYQVHVEVDMKGGKTLSTSPVPLLRPLRAPAGPGGLPPSPGSRPWKTVPFPAPVYVLS
jgi:hypothetical protein